MPENYPLFLEKVLESMKAEAQAAETYDLLLRMAPRLPDHREFLLHIRDDEVKHYRMFTQIYRELTGSSPPTPRVPPGERPRTYREGLRAAMKDELAAYEFYREMYLMIQDLHFRDLLCEIISDENEHALRLSFLYFDAKESRAEQTVAGQEA